MKKILLISCSIIYQDARVMSYIQSLIGRGHAVTVISLKEDDSDPTVSQEDGYVNYKVATRYIGYSFASYVKYYLLFSLRCFRIVTRLSLRDRIDVVHYNNLPNFPVFAALVPKLFGAIVLLDNHDLIATTFAAKFHQVKSKLLVSTILLTEQLSAAMFADKVITADHNQKDYLVNIGVPEDKISVIMNVANENFFKPDRRIRHDHEFRLVYHGTVAKRLGLDLAIEAVALAQISIPEIKFHLIGKGDHLDVCESLVAKHKLENTVFLSHCFYPVKELSPILNTMDVGIIPYRKNIHTDMYGMSVKLLEYVFMGIPVIAPRFKIINRYFDDSMIKFFEPGNTDEMARCIIELYLYPMERTNLVENSKKFIESYNWKKQESFYYSLIE